MTVKTGSAWAGTFVTLDATGAKATPSVGPAGVLYVDGVANGASVTISGANPYKFAVTLPTLTAGQRVDMYITATISTIATAGFVASEQADTNLSSDVTLATTQPAITWAQQKIVADVASEGALDIQNTNALGIGQRNKAPIAGLDNQGGKGAGYSEINGIGQRNTGFVGTENYGESVGVEMLVKATGTGGGLQIDNGGSIYSGIQVNGHSQINGQVRFNEGITVTGASALALEATLTAMKGAGWSDETLAALMVAVEAIATWSSAAISASYTAGAISDIRGSSWSIAMTSLTLDTNKQQFSIKRKATDLDSESILFVESATGMVYINGVAATASEATLVYSGTTLTLVVKAASTAQLPIGTFHYGIQSVTAAGLVEEPYGGTFSITEDIVRASA